MKKLIKEAILITAAFYAVYALSETIVGEIVVDMIDVFYYDIEWMTSEMNEIMHVTTIALAVAGFKLSAEFVIDRIANFVSNAFYKLTHSKKEVVEA